MSINNIITKINCAIFGSEDYIASTLCCTHSLAAANFCTVHMKIS